MYQEGGRERHVVKIGQQFPCFRGLASGNDCLSVSFRSFRFPPQVMSQVDVKDFDHPSNPGLYFFLWRPGPLRWRSGMAAAGRSSWPCASQSSQAFLLHLS